MIPWYRQLIKRDSYRIEHPGLLPIDIGRGDYIRSDLISLEPPNVRKFFGSPVKGSRIEGEDGEGRNGNFVIRLAHHRGRRSSSKKNEDVITVIGVAPAGEYFDKACDGVREAVRNCHVKARGIVATPWAVQNTSDDLEVWRLDASSPDKIAKAASQKAKGVCAFVDDDDTSIGWLRRRLDALPWYGPSLVAPDVGWSRSVIDSTPGLSLSSEMMLTLNGPPPVNVIVTAYNSPDVLLPCLESIVSRTKYPNYRIIVVDDHSDGFTESALVAFRDNVKAVDVSLVRNPENIGYLRTANKALDIAFSGEHPAEYAVLVNSDVLVTPGWLSGMVLCATRTGAGLVNPMCNSAGGMSLPLVMQSGAYSPRVEGGLGYLDIANALSAVSPQYMDAVPAIGQCLLISSDVWLKHGPFDEEIYGRGYGEECALWAKVVDSGGRAKMADNVFVYHESHATHGASAIKDEKSGGDAFLKHHGRTFDRHVYKVRRWAQDTAAHRSAISGSKPSSLPVSFITADIGPWGGVYCVLRLVHELSEVGLSASVCHVTSHEHQFSFPFGPKTMQSYSSFGDWSSLMGFDSGIAVATHWYSARLVESIVEDSPEMHPVAFWQDREDFFVGPNGDVVLGEPIVSKYSSIKDRIVNAQWVGDSAIEDLKIESYTHIPVGVDTNLFHPSCRDSSLEKVRVLGMWRPTTKRRGHERLAKVFRQLKSLYGAAVSLELYGQPQSPPPECDVHHGWLSQRDVARLVREVDVFLEPSDFQGFGLPGLEAMASGVALVSTDNQGIHEYGRSGLNCIISSDDDGFIAAAIRFIDDPEYRSAIGEAARQTALDFDWRVIADRWVCELKEIVYNNDSLHKYRDSITAAVVKSKSRLKGGIFS